MSLVILAAILPGLFAQTPKPANPVADWPMYNHDSASTRYSPLKPIDATNVAKLTQAWTFTTIVINGIMYVPAANLVVAIDTDGGKEVWRYQLAPGQASTRGVSYWPGFIGSVNDNRFRAFDSKNGRELWSFDLHAVGGANPMVFQGKNGQEYVAIVAGRTVHTFALP